MTKPSIVGELRRFLRIMKIDDPETVREYGKHCQREATRELNHQRRARRIQLARSARKLSRGMA